MTKRLLTTVTMLWSMGYLFAQNPFPASGFTLPAGKSITISYEVTVNANACTNGTVPADISNQSQVQGSNFATVSTDDPDIVGSNNPTLTPFGAITIGNFVYKDVNKDGDYDSGTDTPIDGVLLRLYVDADNSGGLSIGDGAHIATATTTGGGLYAFNVCPGNYILEVAPANFNSGGPLYDNTLMNALVSSPIGGAPDPDLNTTDNDDNGDPVSGFGVATAAFTVAYDPNPANTSIYNHIDFGFKTPTIVSINNVMLTEGTGAGPTAFNFTVTRSDDYEAFSLTVNTAGGTATSGTDFTAISGGTVSFAANDNNTTATVTVNVAHDNIVEDNETFTVNLSAAPAGIVITDGTGDGTITNDDNATLTLGITGGGASQNEGSPFSFTATLNNPVQGGFQVAYTTNDGMTNPANSPSDYTDNDGNLTFLGNANEPQSWTVNTGNDNTVELDETIRAILGSITMTSAVQAAAISISASPQTATLLNDDAATVSIAADVSQPEATTPQNFSVTLSNPVDVNVTVQFSTTAGTATAGSDYTTITNQLVTFNANTTTAQTVGVTIAPDNIVEANETYTAGIATLNASGRNVSLGASSRTGTILNDDNATVTLSPVGGVSQNEGNGSVTNFQFTATVDNAVQGGFLLGFSTIDGTATSPSDYTGGSSTLSFNGTANQAINIDIGVNGDLDIENDEDFTVQLGAVSGTSAVQAAAISIAGSPKTGTILNDEKDWGDAPTNAQSGFPNSYPTTAAQSGASHNLAPGGLRLGATVDADPDGQPTATANGDGADEDGVTLPGAFALNTTTSITVNASGAGHLNAWVDWNRNGSWLDAGEQVFTDQAIVAGNNALSIIVPAGAATGNTYARFRLTTAAGTGITGNAADGEVEDYQVNVVSNAYSISSPDVTEGDAQFSCISPSLSIYSISSPDVTEGDAPNTTTLNFVISRLDNSNAGSVDYSAPSGTATPGTDYVAIPGGSINFTAGGSMSETVSVTVNGDAIVEDNETVVISLSNPVNGGIGTGIGTGTITNDDAAILTLSVTGNASQNEGSTFTFSATLNNPVQGGFQVAYTTNDGISNPATAGSDYTDNDGSLIFLGNANESKSWTVTTGNDNTVELDETIRAILGSISMTSAVQAAAITLSGSPQTATLLNDDAATVSIQSDVSQAENITPQTFSVTLSNPVDVNVTVNFNTANNTATTGDNDYTGIVNQTVTFNANTTTAQTVNVTINNDNKVEADETYGVGIGTLSAGGRNVTLGTSSRTGTIQNDDATTVTLTPVGGISLDEGNSGTTNFVFSAELTNSVQGGFSLSYSTHDGTASTADNDYVDNDGPALVFAGTANETKTITVQVNGDNKVEANETFTVQLGSVSNTALGSSITVNNTARTGTIQNDEVDWSDAPDSYATLLASNGARHNTVFGFRLGADIDGENDGQPGANADGDGTDDDGVTLPGALVINTTANLTVNASAPGKLDAWVDFDVNGSFAEAGEKVFNNVALVAGNNFLSFAVPPGATLGTSYARFRLSSAGGLSFNGPASDGEVEDYAVNIVNTLFSIDNPTVTEGNSPNTSNLTFRISRNVNANACSVDYAITGGTASTGDGDYQAFASGTAAFTAGGALFQDITVIVNGDNKVELNETVVMTLSNPVDASIDNGTGIGQITNDDQALISINSPSVVEGPNSTTIPALFEIAMSNPVDTDVNLSFATQNGSASTADSDYDAQSGSQTFSPGQQNKSLSVTVNGDCKIEPDESFALRLSGLSAGGRNVVFSNNSAVLDGIATILNDDAPPVISCPANQLLCSDPATNAAIVNGIAASAISSCSVNFSYTISTPSAGSGTGDASGRSFKVGASTVTYTAIDPANNSATCSFTVTVRRSPNAFWQQSALSICNGSGINLASYARDSRNVAKRYEFYEGDANGNNLVFLGTVTATNGNVNFGQNRWVNPSGNATQPALHYYYIIALNTFNNGPSCGSSLSAALIVTVNPVPVLSANVAPASPICPGNAVSVLFNSTLPATVFWSNSNTGIGLGASGSGNIGFTATAPGVANLFAQASAGSCGSAPLNIPLTISPCSNNRVMLQSGENPFGGEAVPVLYPNPTREQLFLRLPLNESYTGLYATHIEFFDAAGRLVWTEGFELAGGTERRLDLGRLPAGIYGWTLRIGNSSFSGRISKE